MAEARFDTLKISGGYGDTGLDVDAGGNIETDGTLTVDGAITLNGAISANVNISTATSPALKIYESGDTGAFLKLQDNGAGAAYIDVNHDDGNAWLHLDAKSESASDATLRLGRYTNTSGSVLCQWYKGDNTATVTAELDMATGNLQLDGDADIDGALDVATTITGGDNIVITRDADDFIAQDLIAYRNNDSAHILLRMKAAKGSSSSTPAVLGSDSVIAQIQAQAWDGDSFNNAAQIQFKTDGAQGTDDTPGKIVFLVAPDGSSTVATAMTISNDKSITMADDLAVSGNADLSGDLDIAGMVNQTTSELTISSGAVTVTKSRHTIDTEGDVASDFLTDINGGTTGDRVLLSAEHTDRTVVMQETGNLNLGGSSRSLDHTDDRIELEYDGTDWVMLYFTDNAT